MTSLHLQLSLDEVNLILEALGQQPYARVHTLIASLHQQATAQLREAGPDSVPASTPSPPSEPQRSPE